MQTRFPEPPAGRGIGADELYAHQLADLQARVQEQMPELRAKWREIMLAELRQKELSEQLRLEIRQHIGGDAVRPMLDILTAEVAPALKAEKAAAALSKH